MTRTEFAERISAGLAGWLQQLSAQNLDDQVGEDAARVELVRMISAQQAFAPATTQRPTNWPQHTKKRVDIAVLGRNKKTAGGWYGAIELKWPKTNVDVSQTRQRIIEDAIRVAFSSTSNLCANFLIIGGTHNSVDVLFDKKHKNMEKENQRQNFNSLLSRKTQNSAGKLSNNELNTIFPDCGDRVPQTTFNGWTRRLATELLAISEAKVGQNITGYVYVWQIKK